MRDAICWRSLIGQSKFIRATVAPILFVILLTTNYHPVRFICIQEVNKGAWVSNVVSFFQTTNLLPSAFVTQRNGKTINKIDRSCVFHSFWSISSYCCFKTTRFVRKEEGEHKPFLLKDPFFLTQQVIGLITIVCTEARLHWKEKMISFPSLRPCLVREVLRNPLSPRNLFLSFFV